MAMKLMARPAITGNHKFVSFALRYYYTGTRRVIELVTIWNRLDKTIHTLAFCRYKPASQQEP